MPGCLNWTQFSRTSKMVTAGGQQKSLAGLDNISQRFGNEIFQHVRVLVNSIANMSPNLLSTLRDSLLQRIDAFEYFLKREYVSHLMDTSPCSAHCITRLLGGLPHDEAVTCNDCRRVKRHPGPSCLSCSPQSSACRQCIACCGMLGKCKACTARAVYCSDCPASCGEHEEHCSQCDEAIHIFAEMHVMMQIAGGVPANEIALENQNEGSIPKH